MFPHFASVRTSVQCSRKNLTTTICVKTPFVQIPSPLKFFSNNNNVSNPQNWTLDYLRSSCGLSPESALKASKHIPLFKSTTGPDSVLSLLKSYGFTMPQISKIVTRRPPLLSANPDLSLRPKLEYFCTMGISRPALTKIISASPHILGTSLENTIIPSVNYLRTLVGADKGVAAILSKSWWVLNDAQRIMGPNIAILRTHGVPQANISKFLMSQPHTLYQSTNLIKKLLSQLVSIGFDPLSMTFLRGLTALVGMTKSTWDQKMAVYNSYGWSQDEVLSMFKKQPSTMSASVKKITLSLNFFLNDLQWSRDDIAKYPTVVLLSLEKRVIPRCRVLQILHSKNLITKAGAAHGLHVTEDLFLKKYVCKYYHVEPDLSKVYQYKKGTQGAVVGNIDGPELMDKM